MCVTRMPRSRAASESSPRLRAPVETMNFRFGSFSISSRPNGMRSRITMTMSNGCSAVAASSGVMLRVKTVISHFSFTRDQSASDKARFW